MTNPSKKAEILNKFQLWRLDRQFGRIIYPSIPNQLKSRKNPAHPKHKPRKF